MISAQIPLWIAGIYGVISDSHTARANLIQARHLNGYLALHDVLTGLANRAQILQRPEAECSKSGRQARTSVYVLYLDLDGFKAVNDRFGHASGTDLQRAVAGRFRAHIRPSDLLGRLGGDEFAAVLTAMTLDQIHLVASMLIDADKAPFVFEGLPPIHIGFSIGGPGLSTPPDVRRTLEAADAMLYEAKHAGIGIVRLA